MGLAFLFFVLLVQPSEGNTKTVDRGEAKMIALQKAMSSSRLLSLSGWTSTCKKSGKYAFRCVVTLRGQTEWRLKDCRFEVQVTKRRPPRLTSRSCWGLDIPFLTDEKARKTALELVDPEYGSSSNEVWSEGFGRESNTRIEFLFSWTTSDRNCLQEVRVELVDRVARGTVVPTVCGSRPQWPGNTNEAGI
jgi:hypothetical protein